jgi:hypothetical protein
MKGKEKAGKIAMYTVIGLVVAGTIALIVIFATRHHDTLCLCRGIGREDCVDRRVRQHLYETGKRTEFTPQKYVYHDPMAPQTQFHAYKDTGPQGCS